MVGEGYVIAGVGYIMDGVGYFMVRIEVGVEIGVGVRVGVGGSRKRAIFRGKR